MQDKELRDIRDRVQDKEGELDTLRKAGKNLRERLDEKEVETRGIMDRVRAPPPGTPVHEVLKVTGFARCTCSYLTGRSIFFQVSMCVEWSETSIGLCLPPS